jgi:hypothetical protein
MLRSLGHASHACDGLTRLSRGGVVPRSDDTRQGRPIQGRVDVVTVRGQVRVRDGRFVGAQNHGRMLQREPTHGAESPLV